MYQEHQIPAIPSLTPTAPTAETSLADLLKLMSLTMHQMATKIESLENSLHDRIIHVIEEAIDNDAFNDAIESNIDNYMSNNFDLDSHVDIDGRIADYIRDNLNITFDI